MRKFIFEDFLIFWCFISSLRNIYFPSEDKHQKVENFHILFIFDKPILAAKIEGQGESIMSNNVQGSNILDVLKKKMRATKEESEKYKEECEDIQRKLQVELMRREEVSSQSLVNL